MLVFTTAPDGGEALTAQGVEIERVPRMATAGPISPPCSGAWRARDHRVLVEGGPTVHARLSGARVWPTAIHLYRAPMMLGAGGRPCHCAVRAIDLSAAPGFTLTERDRRSGPMSWKAYALTV